LCYVTLYTLVYISVETGHLQKEVFFSFYFGRTEDVLFKPKHVAEGVPRNNTYVFYLQVHLFGII